MEKTVISQLPLWHDHVYLRIVYIQFCCPKFSMIQMKEIISHGAHGSQHFLCGTCPIALFARFFFPQVFCFKCFSRVSLTCVLLWRSSLSPPYAHAHTAPSGSRDFHSDPPVHKLIVSPAWCLCFNSP